jgi:hypothetical protein
MASIKCPNCNLTNWATSVSCNRCDYDLQKTQNGESRSQFVSPDNSANFGSNSPLTQINTKSPHRTRQAYSRPERHNPQNQKRGLAIFSLIMGIISFPPVNVVFAFVLSFILSKIFGDIGAGIGFLFALVILPVGLIVGIVSLRKTKNSPTEYGGKGLATAGIVFSVIGLVTLPIVATKPKIASSSIIANKPLIYATGLPNVLVSKRAENEYYALGTVRTINASQLVYKTTFGAGNCGELNQLIDKGLIEKKLASGVNNGYIFTVIKIGNGCDVSARPENLNDSFTAIRSFYISDVDSETRFSDVKGDFATKNSPIFR